MTFILSFM